MFYCAMFRKKTQPIFRQFVDLIKHASQRYSRQNMRNHMPGEQNTKSILMPPQNTIILLYPVISSTFSFSLIQPCLPLKKKSMT